MKIIAGEEPLFGERDHLYQKCQELSQPGSIEEFLQRLHNWTPIRFDSLV